jgi:transcriptional antiterminator RfaH
MDSPPNWYAVYTKPRFEKKLAGYLKEKGIEAYLPLKKTLRQWSDRKKIVEVPLMSSYVFVNVVPDQYYEVLNTQGAVKYIWFNGKPAVIPAKQIETLRLITGADVEIDCVQGTIPAGSRIRVAMGPLKDLTGELLNYAGKHKVVVRIDHLDKVLMLTISPQFLETVEPAAVS